MERVISNRGVLHVTGNRPSVSDNPFAFHVCDVHTGCAAPNIFVECVGKGVCSHHAGSSFPLRQLDGKPSAAGSSSVVRSEVLYNATAPVAVSVKPFAFFCPHYYQATILYSLCTHQR